MQTSKPTALIFGISGQDGASLSRLLLDKGYAAHGTSRDADMATFDNLAALEHVVADAAVIDRLRACLRPSREQLHIVPSGWGLMVYLWRGCRQYSRGAIADRFDPIRTPVFRLGGAPRLLLHLIWITVPDILLRISLREHLPAPDQLSLVWALRLDHWLPMAATMYAVFESSHGGGSPISTSI